MESIVRELQELPTPKQVEVARYVHRLSAEAQKKRWDVLGRLYGTLNEEDGKAFEEALRGSRRLPATDDLYAERGTVLIRLGKGKIDRMIPVGERALAWVRR